MEGPVRIAVTSRSLFDGGAETLHFSGTGTLRRTAAGWDLPYSAACRENGAAIASRIRQTQARLPMGLTVTARTQMLDFSLEGPEGCINLAYTLLDRGLPLSRMQLTIRITKET